MASLTGIDVFGELVLRAGPASFSRWPTARCREVLGFLLLRPGEPVPRSWLIQNVWPDLPVEECRNRLSVTLAATKRELAAAGIDLGSVIEVTRQNLTARDLGEVNELVRFRKLVKSDRIEDWREAVSIHRGPLLVAVDHPWVRVARSEARADVQRLALLLAKHEEDNGNERGARILRERAAWED